MPTSFEDLLTQSLRGRAEGGSPIDPEPLRSAAVTRGNRLRKRRRTGTAGIAALAVAAVTLAGLTVQRERPDHAVRPVASTPPSPVVTPIDGPRLPIAAGVAGALADPAAVASDLGLLHFSADQLVARGRLVEWEVTGTYETLRLNFTDSIVQVTAARSRDLLPIADGLTGHHDKTGATFPVVVGGVPVVAIQYEFAYPGSGDAPPEVWSVVWQPAPGFWAEVAMRTDDPAKAAATAGQIRFDQVRRCPHTFRVGSPPPGATLRACYGNLTYVPGAEVKSAYTRLTFGNGTKRVDFAGPSKVTADSRDYAPDQVQRALASVLAGPDPADPARW